MKDVLKTIKTIAMRNFRCRCTVSSRNQSASVVTKGVGKIYIKYEIEEFTQKYFVTRIILIKYLFFRNAYK